MDGSAITVLYAFDTVKCFSCHDAYQQPLLFGLWQSEHTPCSSRHLGNWEKVVLRARFVTQARFVTKVTKRVRSDAVPACFVTPARFVTKVTKETKRVKFDALPGCFVTTAHIVTTW